MAKNIIYSPGRQVFLTLVTRGHAPILREHVHTVLAGWEQVASRHEMELIAWTVLSDHAHFIIDTRGLGISALTHSFRLASGRLFRGLAVTGRKPLWSSGAFMQTLKSKHDLERHIDFVHYNSVKHGAVAFPWEYPHSSFREFVMHGYYLRDWTLSTEQHAALRDLDDSDVIVTHKAR